MTRLVRNTVRRFSTMCMLLALCGCVTERLLPGIPVGSWLHADLAVPDTYPLGSISAAHWHTMETNAEAGDFVINRSEFVTHSPQLTPHGQRHVMEIAARLGNVPFPVLVQPSANMDQRLDGARRESVIQLLNQLNVYDAATRTLVSEPYSNGIPTDTF